MRKRKIFLWYLLLNKRLFKKISFLLILCIVPLLILVMRQAASQDSGMIKIMLCRENPSDELSAEVIQALASSKSVIQYITGTSEEDALDAVKSGSVDAAWIFPDHMQEKIEDFTSQSSSQNPILTIVEREDNVALQLSREKLYGVLYPYISYSIYHNYISQNLAQGMSVMEEELRADYEETRVDGGLFRRTYVNNKEVEETEEAGNYLLLPLRGLLSLWLVLCGLAASMYFIQDKESGVFSWVPVRKEMWLAYGYHFIVIGDAGIVMLLALKLSGLFTTLGTELVLLLLMILMSAAFCNFVRILCQKVQRLTVCTPLLILAMLVLCPIFLDVHKFRPVQYLLPPFYYLNALHNPAFLYRSIIYCVILFGLDFLLNRLVLTK